MINWEPGQKAMRPPQTEIIKKVSYLYLAGSVLGALAGEKEAAALFAGLGIVGLALTKEKNAFARHKLGPDRL